MAQQVYPLIPSAWGRILRFLGKAALVGCVLQAGATAAQETMPPPAGEVAAFAVGPLTAVLVLPSGDGVRPSGLVLMVHDSLGPDQRSTRYVDQLLGAGIAVIDALQAEDDPSRHAELLAAIAADPRTEGLRIGVLGFGAGGRAASRLEGRFAGRALLYPGCQGLDAPPESAPHAVFLAHGDEDAANTNDSCLDAAARMTQAGLTVRHRVYASAGYAWDHPIYGIEQRILLPQPDGTGRVAIAPWPELTTVAASQVAAFFSSSFRAAP